MLLLLLHTFIVNQLVLHAQGCMFANGRRGSAPLLQPEELLGGLRGGAERPDQCYLSRRRGSAPSQQQLHPGRERKAEFILKVSFSLEKIFCFTRVSALIYWFKTLTQECIQWVQCFLTSRTKHMGWMERCVNSSFNSCERRYSFIF